MARGPIKKKDYDDEIQKAYERIERLKGHIKEVEEIIVNLKAEKEQANLVAIQEILKTCGMTTDDLLQLAKGHLAGRNGLTV